MSYPKVDKIMGMVENLELDALDVSELIKNLQDYLIDESTPFNSKPIEK